MSSFSKITDSRQSSVVEELISRLASLSEEEKKTENIFPLIFGEIAAVESSEGFEKLKNKQWYVLLAHQLVFRIAMSHIRQQTVLKPVVMVCVEKVFKLLTGFSRSANCWLSPKVILLPTSPEQVSQILALVKFLGTTFSIRGGGHLQNPGFTSNNGGVVISLSNLNKITLSEDKSTAKIGAGLT